MFSYITDIMNIYSLMQVVPSYTHVSPRGRETLIDLALLSDMTTLQSCSTIPPLSTSDHLGVSLVVKVRTCRKKATRYSNSRLVWMYKDANSVRANNLIEQTDWDGLLTDDVDESTELWTNKLLEIMKLCIPHKYLPSNTGKQPWLTRNIIKHMRKRNCLFKKAKKVSTSNTNKKLAHLIPTS